MIEPVLLIAIFLVAALAFANGSNDVSKGVATLVGSGVADYPKAMLWGTVWTVAGGFLGLYLSTAVVATFMNGIVSAPAGAVRESSLPPVAVMIGATGWVLFAARVGLPVSTTHAITGALCGVGLAAWGVGGVQWASLMHKVILPLSLSPLLAWALTFLVFPAVRRLLQELEKQED